MHQTPVEPSGSQFADPFFNFLVKGDSHSEAPIDCVISTTKKIFALL